MGVRAEPGGVVRRPESWPWIFPMCAALRDDARAWCAGRSWLWRAPLLVYLFWAGVRHIRDPLYQSLFGGITLGVHELGHLVFGLAGSWPGVAGGSLAQVAAPAAAAWILGRQRDYFGVAVAGAWFAFSLFGVATYAGDARAQELPLVALGPDPVHDWNWMLGRLGLLSADHTLAFLMRAGAVLVWIAAIALGGWLLWVMAESSKSKGVSAGTASSHPDFKVERRT